MNISHTRQQGQQPKNGPANRLPKKVNLSGFKARFKNDEEGRPAYDPWILSKVILLGHTRCGILQSQKLERACHENVTFMALACGQTPDYRMGKKFSNNQ